MTTNLIHIAIKSRIDIAQSEFPYKPPRLAIPPDRSLEKNWYVEYYIWDYTAQKLRRKRIVLAQPTERQRLREGTELSKRVLELLQKGAYVNGPDLNKPVKKETHLVKAFEYYLSHLIKNVKPSTYSSRRTHIKRIEEFLQLKQYSSIQVNHFTADHALEFSDYMNSHLTISNRTKNNCINELVTVFNFFMKRKLIAENPFANIDKLPAPAKRHTAFRPDQVELFKMTCLSDPQLWLFVLFVYYCAIRPRKELRFLKIKDIGSDTITISSENAKSGRKDYIRIPPPLLYEIEKNQLRDQNPEFYVFGANGHPGEKPTYKNQIYRRHRIVLDQIGALNQDVDLYSWKHTGAIALWKATQNIQLLKEHLRHTDVASTLKYLRDLGQFTDYTEVNKFPQI